MCVQATSTTSTTGSVLMYASTDCSGDPILSDTNYQTCNANLGFLIEDYLVSTVPQYGIVYTEWIGTSECTSTAPGASWVKSMDCFYYGTQGDTDFYLKTTCMGSSYIMYGFNDTACTNPVAGLALGPYDTQTCKVYNNGSTAYPYESAKRITCDATVPTYSPPPPPCIYRKSVCS